MSNPVPARSTAQVWSGANEGPAGLITTGAVLVSSSGDAQEPED